MWVSDKQDREEEMGGLEREREREEERQRERQRERERERGPMDAKSSLL